MRSQNVWQTVPKRDETPPAASHLIDWYQNVYVAGESGIAGDPILGLRDLGREIWADENADAYVRRQREGWQ